MDSKHGTVETNRETERRYYGEREEEEDFGWIDSHRLESFSKDLLCPFDF